MDFPHIKKEVNQVQEINSFLLSLELPLVIILLLVSAAIEKFTPFALATAFLFLLDHVLTRQIPVVKNSYYVLFVLFSFLVFLNFWITPLRKISIPQIQRLLFGILVFYSVVNWCNSRRRLSQAFWLFLGCGIVISLVTPIIVLVFTDKLPPLPPILLSTFDFLFLEKVNPNVMAGILVILIPLPLSSIFFAKKMGKEFVLSVICFLIMFLSLLVTRSRGAFLAFAAVLILLAIFRWPHSRLLYLLIFGSLASLGLILWFLASRDTNFYAQAIKTIEIRLEIWRRAWMITRDFPFTGVGIGTFSQIADNFYPFFLSQPGSIRHTHNLFLQIAVDLGIPGFVLWFGIFGLVICDAWKMYSRRNCITNETLSSLGIGLLGSYLALTVHGLFDMVVWGMMRLAPIAWGLWGFAVAGYLILDKQVE